MALRDTMYAIIFILDSEAINRIVFIGVVIADSIFLLVKIFGDEDLGDFKYLGSAFITSMCSVCVLGSILYVSGLYFVGS